MNPALIIDTVVSNVSRMHPLVIRIMRPILYPFILWRIRDIAHTLATRCRWLPPTSWEKVEKHGKMVVYGICRHTDVFTKEEHVKGVWVVDYIAHTVRVVEDVPPEHRVIAATF